MNLPARSLNWLPDPQSNVLLAGIYLVARIGIGNFAVQQQSRFYLVLLPVQFVECALQRSLFCFWQYIQHFFARYRMLFGSRRTAIGVNALAFGLADLFYWNWPAIVPTTIGGAVFARAYAETGSFAYACLLHAVAGRALFATGLGSRNFFHGSAGAMSF